MTSLIPSDDIESKKLWWHSRRGMLELDVLLVPFVEQVYPTLGVDDKARYKKLLSCEDTDMFEWFMQRSRPQDPDLQRIVDMILNRVQPD
ncbi:FAD assembly factor SdhE [Marinobacter sp. C2H3]|uniref:FAD assembly factor SdhE n=1 Tax=Marinobacter sp. C2H3 TaxID=3119003 RepID=UPI00300EA5A2